jgi:hypothetical protein
MAKSSKTPSQSAKARQGNKGLSSQLLRKCKQEDNGPDRSGRNNQGKKGWGSGSSGRGPELKPQYCKKKKKKGRTERRKERRNKGMKERRNKGRRLLLNGETSGPHMAVGLTLLSGIHAQGTVIVRHIHVIHTSPK